MKLCQLCGQMSPLDAVTCPNDGEASWMHETMPPSSSLDLPDAESPAAAPAPVVDDASAPKRKPSKRGG